MPNANRRRRIAPRLQDGSSRESSGGGLPQVVKQWARLQAERAGVSLSFWKETLILEEWARCDRRRSFADLYRAPSPKRTTNKRGSK